MEEAGTRSSDEPDDGAGPAPEGPFSISLRSLLMVVCLLALLMVALTPWYHAKRMRAAVSRVKADQRTFATALESYRIDFMTYPSCGLTEGPPRTAPDGTVIAPWGTTVHSHLPPGVGARDEPKPQDLPPEPCGCLHLQRLFQERRRLAASEGSRHRGGDRTL